MAIETLLGGRPLLDTRADSALFVDREREVEKVRSALAHGLNVLLVGERGSGKTSLVRRVMYLDDYDTDVAPRQFVFVRGTGTQTPAELLDRILSQTAPDDTSFAEMTGHGDMDELVPSLRRWAAEHRAAGAATVVLDEPPPTVANGLIGPLRDELWALGLTWIITVRTGGVMAVTAPPADAFFEMRVDLPPLGAREATELLKRRVPDDLPTAVVAEAIRLSEGNPRRLLDTARALLTGEARSGATPDGYPAQQSALAALGRPAQMLFAELQALGQASASDAELLERMGWTRPRAVQVFGQLEDAGLVTSENVKGTEGGRPKKVYAAIPASRFQPRTQEETR